MASVAGEGHAPVGVAPSASELPPFLLERWFAKWEFKAKHLLCCSDCQVRLASSRPLALPYALTTVAAETHILSSLDRSP